MKGIQKSKKGFTMLELVMVITIMALLAAIMVPQFSVQREQAEIATTKANLETMRTAITLYESKTGNLPSAAGDFITEGILRVMPKDGIQGKGLDVFELGTCPCSGNGGWCMETSGDVYPAITGNDYNGVSFCVY